MMALGSIIKSGRVLLVLLPGIAFGCAQMFPAAVKEVEPGIYRVQASGNSFTSAASLRNKVESKALKLCEPVGFEEVSAPTHEFLQQKTYSGNYTYSAGYQVVTRYVRCLRPDPN